jgi:hypothetical protein
MVYNCLAKNNMQYGKKYTGLFSYYWYKYLLRTDCRTTPSQYGYNTPSQYRYNTSSHEVKLTWEMIKTLTMRNNDTTPRHIGVGSTHWVSPQCTLVLCHCCVQRVQGSLPNLHTGSHLMWGGVVPMLYWCCKSTTNMVLRMSAFRIEQILLQTLCKLRWQFIWH